MTEHHLGMKKLTNLIIDAIKAGDIGNLKNDDVEIINNKEVGSRYLTADGLSVTVVQTTDVETMDSIYSIKNGVNEVEIKTDTKNWSEEVHEALEDLLGI